MSKRLIKEIDNAQRSTCFQFYYDGDKKYSDETAAYLRFTVDEGNYRDQTHILQMKFDYGKYRFPIDSPNVLFMTPIYHPNISSTGAICLDILKTAWNPTYNIEAVFNSIRLLLNEANIDDPFNSSAAKLYHDRNFSVLAQEYYKVNIANLSGSTLLSIPFPAPGKRQ